jgi:hypothetical protein
MTSNNMSPGQLQLVACPGSFLYAYLFVLTSNLFNSMEQETYRTNKVLIFYEFAKHRHVRLNVNHKSNWATFSEYTRITDRMLLSVEVIN